MIGTTTDKKWNKAMRKSRRIDRLVPRAARIHMRPQELRDLLMEANRIGHKTLIQKRSARR